MNSFKILLLLSIALLVYGSANASAGYQGVLLNPEKSIQSTELIDHNGNNVAFPAAAGKYQLVFLVIQVARIYVRQPCIRLNLL